MRSDFIRSVLGVVLGALCISFWVLPLSSFAQHGVSYKLTPEEQRTVDMMRADGATEKQISHWILERKLLGVSPKNNSVPKKSGTNATGTCGDMGAEAGWSVWEAATGDYVAGP